jgi:hypothetical protein
VSDRAAAALISIGPAAVPALIPSLHDQDPRIRAFAARIFRFSGLEANAAVPDLIASLHDPSIGKDAATALVSIAGSLRDNKRIDTIDQLNREAHELDAASFHAEAQRVRTAADLLRGYQRSQWLNPEAAISEHPGIIALVAAYLVLSLLCLFLLWARPLALWRINELLGADRKVKLDWLFGLEISLAHLLLVGFLRYHSRVLDAWVAKYLGEARAQFNQIRTVQQHEAHVRLPIRLDGKMIDELKPEHLKALFASTPARLLVWGEGGAGKTSFACHVARWVMAEDTMSRPSRWPMLPLIIEEDLKLEVGKDKNVLTEAIRGKLKELAQLDEAPSEELLRHLLRRQRILLVVDGLSELNDDTRNRLNASDPEFDARALVVTSRAEELSGFSKSVLQPLRIEGGYISSFMEDYLRECGSRVLFDDSEFFENCRRFSLMVSGRDATVLLVRLFADQMIAAKAAGTETLPENTADLMFEYLNRLNRGEGLADRTVHAAVKAIAWESLRKSYQPMPADYKAVVAALGEDAEAQIEYLEKDLKLVQVLGSARDALKLTLDPLAEYLAALHLREECGSDEDSWKEFLVQADHVGAPENIKGFLLALRDCCVARPEPKVPDFVVAQLEARANFDSAPLQKVRLEQRIRDLKSRLRFPFAEDRATAAEALGKLGLSAKSAIPALIQSLKDEDAKVRAEAAEALSAVRPEGKLASPALIEALGDVDESVRLNALKAAWSIAPGDSGLLSATVAFLKDSRKGAVFVAAAMRLRQVSPTETAFPALMDVLDDKESAPFAFQTLKRDWPEIVASLPGEKRRRYEEWRRKRRMVVPETDPEPDGGQVS